MSAPPALRVLAVLAAATVPFLAAGPAAASTGTTAPETMSVGEAVLVFAGIPLALAGLIWLLVAAPGWTRGGRADATSGWTGDPLMLGGERAPEPQALTAGDDDVRTGGTGATW